MFTGIIKDIGTILKKESIKREGKEAVTLVIKPKYPLDLELGDSVSTNGACLTVTNIVDDTFYVDLSPETMEKTTFKYCKENDKVNLETSLVVGQTLGGHFVTGHIDTVTSILNIESVVGGNTICTVELPEQFKSFVAYKGSVALDGVSLTINSVKDNFFTLNVIPHTWRNTCFEYKKIGDKLNMEIDMIARYIDRYIEVNKKE